MKIEPLISVKNLSKVFNRKEEPFLLFDSLFLDLFVGESIALIGPSGSGKSTLAKILAGFDPQSREILFQGSPHCGNPKLEVQLIFQNPFETLTPHMTIRNLLQETHQVNPLKRRDLLKSLRLSERHLEAFPHQLSGGEAQRIALLRALIVEPEYLICDEILSSIDSFLQGQIIDLLKTLQKEYGFGIFWITHNLEVAQIVASKILLLFQKRLQKVSFSETGSDSSYLNELIEAMRWMER